MWQKAVKPYVDAGEMVAIGVVQEQHPDRTRLYRQWRELDWPIFVDSMNTLEHIMVVPVPVAINQAGIVAHQQFKPDQLKTFVRTELEMPDIPADYNRIRLSTSSRTTVGGHVEGVVGPPQPGQWTPDMAGTPAEADALHNMGRGFFNFSTPETLDSSLDLSIMTLEKAAKVAPEDGAIHFSLGTALRRRYESPHRKSNDNQRAVEHWGLALDANPNHYIYRRRLQQYGPRLDKPYNFYFWVQQARADIRARGAKPLPLTAEPMGSEIAQPERKGLAKTSQPLINPDPRGRINRDENQLVHIEPLVTPSRVRPGHRLRARVTFRLSERSEPWWNNEADDLIAWVDMPDGFALTENSLSFSNPANAETRELREIEVELEVGANVPEGEVTLPAYALYYVCEDAGGVCYYLRQDFSLSVTIDAEAPALK